MALFKELNRQTITTARKTGIPYVLFSENEQVGNTFGERFTNALTTVFESGYDQVITIGNDTPHLTAGHILLAQEKLKQSTLVIGPSTDGGCYLMGIKKNHFKPEQFKNLPWQSSKLGAIISDTLSRKHTNLYLLETLSDLDTFADLQQILKEASTLSKRILQLIQNIVNQGVSLGYYTTNRFFESLTKSHFNKGSPSLVRI
ncbi:hypothetical protein JM84_1044 [Dokdonia sp. Hel_I_63]|uniref:TIGR04282 family arsenosugar biosynthesis glycosyltransferase n=1 Tax=unclassified Dokdonia TaxID=2615033 RepID=UPI00020A7116|nr:MULTISPECIES: DUF2064 domain-containing protein [unclassified Dokdonia]AEE18612.1 Protein of unknown function DUF2064 [Dokdonia sp. 4H-3-7-5]TVZ22159.1 hypothetical protein JM84_1044 [Dokdonia sp. Hel_I_63]